jgi:hypothetical protein
MYVLLGVLGVGLLGLFVIQMLNPPKAAAVQPVDYVKSLTPADAALILEGVANQYARDHKTPQYIMNVTDCVPGNPGNGHYFCAFVMQRKCWGSRIEIKETGQVIVTYSARTKIPTIRCTARTILKEA